MNFNKNDFHFAINNLGLIAKLIVNPTEEIFGIKV